MNKILFRRRAKYKKSLFPLFIVCILLWGFLGSIVYFIDPYSPGALLLFFLVLFLALFLSASLVLTKRRGVLIASGVVLFLFLRYIGLGNILNLVLIIGIATATDFYLSSRGS